MSEIINDWKPETTSLVALLLENKVELTGGDNGEESFAFDDDLAKFIDSLIACDESRLYVKLPDGQRGWLFLVLGNEPGVIVSDYSVHPVLDRVTDTHYELWHGRTQPTKRRDEVNPGDRVTAQAIAVLLESERGQRALRDFQTLIDNGGFNLDLRGKDALVKLALAAQGGKTYFID